MSNQGNRQKVKSKAEIGQTSLMNFNDFGNKLKIPAHIQKELDEEGLIGRFVSLKKIQDSGGYHPMGWTPYLVKNPQMNPITQTAEKTFRIGDLVLAVKTKHDHAQHVAWLKQKSDRQTSQHKNNVKEMRDRIRDSRADKHISLIEGYEENDKDDE